MPQLQPRPQSTGSKPAQDALITAPTAPLVELRQNNPQDCANLIAASVDRATVEISRTIIALNATFSQQLQQASISASNGIKSAENSASSSISIVSQNASSATSSASFSLNLANLAVTSVNSALTNANIALASAQSQVVGVNLVLTSALSASTSDVLRLSSSLSSLEATLISVQASASTALALAIMSQQALKDPQVTAAISLAPVQLAGIVVGTMLASIFLSFAVGFVLLRARNKEKKGFVNDKGSTLDPKMPLSRNSMGFRPGNSVVIRFSPPTSAYDFPPAPERHGSLSATPSALETEKVPKATVWDDTVAPNNSLTSRIDEWPLTASFNDNLDGTSDEIWSHTTITIPYNMSAQNTEPTPDPSPARDFYFNKSRNTVSTLPGPEVIEALQQMDLDEDSWPIHEPTQESSYEPDAKEDSGELVPVTEAVEDPFKDPVMELDESFVEGFSGDLVEQSSEQPTEASSKTVTDDGHLQEAVGPQTSNFLNNQDDTPVGKDVKALVACEAEDLLSEPRPSCPIVVAHTQYPEPNLPEQGETSNQRSYVHYSRTTSPGQIQEHIPEKENLSGIGVIAIQTLTDSGDATPPPLRQNPKIDFPERRVNSQSPNAVNDEREISPLRRNPPFEPFEAIISLLDGQGGGATKLEEDADEYESRGRSMIRTSDIIEARLSGLAQADNAKEEMLQQRDGQGEPDDLQPASSAPAQRSPSTDQVHRLRTPPKRKPVAANQVSTKDLPPLTSNSLSRPVSATSAAVTPRRDESSPLRRNPPDINPPPRRALGTGATASGSTKEFSQALSKFQTLISQNSQDAVVASNEVTSRAIAGIYIPGSLREQAVRNLSKSRERGTGEKQRK